MQNFIVFNEIPQKELQQWDLCSRSVAFPFTAFKVVFYFVLFSKLAIVFWFRTWRNLLVVFVFKCWCFFLGVIQRWVFWGELQWIIASENMRGDLPNFRRALILHSPAINWFMTELRRSPLPYLTYLCPQLCSFEYSKSDGGQNLCIILCPLPSALFTAKAGMKCSRREKEKAFLWLPFILEENA